MGKISHLTPLRFAEELRAYLWEQIEPRGSDKSGRWLEAATDGARSRDYWRKVIAGTQAMTTNDIEVIAGLFEQTPYEFIRAVRDWATPAGELIKGRFPPDVGGFDDDFEITIDGPAEGVPVAAHNGTKKADEPPAE